MGASPGQMSPGSPMPGRQGFGMGGMVNPITGNRMTGIGPGHPLYDPGGVMSDDFIPRNPPSMVPFNQALQSLRLGQNPGGYGMTQPYMPPPQMPSPQTQGMSMQQDPSIYWNMVNNGRMNKHSMMNRRG